MQEFQYFRPKTLSEAIELLDRHEIDIKILSGGTDLLVALRDKAVKCKYLMDIKAICELQNISFSDDNGLAIGAAVCLDDIIRSEEIRNNYQILVEAAKTLANSLLRNRATLIGNICNASPGGDMISPAIVLGGVLEVVSKQGTRNIPLKEFFLGVKKTTLKENELVTKITFPYIKGSGKYLRKSRIKGHDLAQVGIAAFLKDTCGLSLAVGAAGPTPIIIEGFENFTKADIRNNRQDIIHKVLSEITPISDQRASKEFRTAMIEYLTGQLLDELGKEI